MEGSDRNRCGAWRSLTGVSGVRLEKVCWALLITRQSRRGIWRLPQLTDAIASWRQFMIVRKRGRSTCAGAAVGKSPGKTAAAAVRESRSPASSADGLDNGNPAG